MFRSFALLVLVSLTTSALIGCSSGSDDSPSDTNKAGDDSKTSAASGKEDQGGGKFGSVIYKISGNVEAGGELPFQPAASVFSGGAWALTFGRENGQEIMAINLAKEGANLLFGDGKITVIGVASGAEPTCAFKVDKQDGGGAKGSFECANASGTGKNGALYADGIKVQGTFEARAK